MIHCGLCDEIGDLKACFEGLVKILSDRRVKWHGIIPDEAICVAFFDRCGCRSYLVHSGR